VVGTSTAATAFGVAGVNESGGGGTYGRGVTGITGHGIDAGGAGSGVIGYSDKSVGVVGTSRANVGVAGTSTGSVGVTGTSTAGIGVTGHSTANIGVVGESQGGEGVRRGQP
jgi:hypothetical protein